MEDEANALRPHVETAFDERTLWPKHPLAEALAATAIERDGLANWPQYAITPHSCLAGRAGMPLLDFF